LSEKGSDSGVTNVLKVLDAEAAMMDFQESVRV
jgi:hypothetical protein